MAVHVSHNPFGRTSLHRTPSRKACACCGARIARGRPWTFIYTVESDARARAECREPRADSPAFCNLECFRTYYSDEMGT